MTFLRLGMLPATLGLALVAATSSVQAESLTFSGVGDTGSLLFETTRQGADLSVTAAFTVTALSSGTATLAVTVSNDSTGEGTNRLTAFAIDVVSPTLTGADANDIWDATLTTAFPTLSQVDLCIYAANGCAGGNINDGIGEGVSSTFVLTLNTGGDFLAGGLTFTSPYGIKFQDVGTGGQSYEFEGCVDGRPGCGGNDNTIPEPGSLLLAGLALTGLAATRRRRSL